jgi:hypothetical protein
MHEINSGVWQFKNEMNPNAQVVAVAEQMLTNFPGNLERRSLSVGQAAA